MTIDRIKQLVTMAVDGVNMSMDERKVHAFSAAEGLVDHFRNGGDIVLRTKESVSTGWNAIGFACLYAFRCCECGGEFPAGTEGAMIKNRPGRKHLYRCEGCS